MKKAKATLMAVLLLTGFGLAACDDEMFFRDIPMAVGEGDPRTVTLDYIGIETLAVRPAYVKIVGIGETVQLSADIWFKDGSLTAAVKESVTPPALAESTAEPDPIPLEWGTENYGIADVDDTGLVTAVSSGETLIHVSVDGHEALARVIVQNRSSLDPNIDTIDPP